MAAPQRGSPLPESKKLLRKDETGEPPSRQSAGPKPPPKRKRDCCRSCFCHSPLMRGNKRAACEPGTAFRIQRKHDFVGQRFRAPVDVEADSQLIIIHVDAVDEGLNQALAAFGLVHVRVPELMQEIKMQIYFSL